jgi:DNA-directed RNA polymerase specialized sigma24 family protein
MSGQDAPRDLTAGELCERCRDETRRFRRGEPDVQGFCFEAVRRAVVGRDEHCWSELTAIYHDLVAGWCRRSGSAEDDLDGFVSAAWVKFWQGYTAEKLAEANGSIAAALAYLKACARSAVLDERRRRARLDAHEEPAPDDVQGRTAEAGAEVERLDRDAFWELIGGHLRDERERLIVHLTYEIGLRPAEIYGLHRDRFADVREVYKMTRNVLDRLRRSRPLADWLGPERE